MIGRLLEVTGAGAGWSLLRIAWSQPPPAPGNWLNLHLQGGRLPLPIRAVSAREGWLAGVLPRERLPVGLRPGMPLRIDGPAGTSLPTATAAPALVLGVGAAVGPALYLCERLDPPPRLALLGGVFGVPGRAVPSRFLTPSLPPQVIGAVPALEALGIPSRVAATAGAPGYFEGSPVEMLEHYLAGLSGVERRALHLLACVPAGDAGSEDGALRFAPRPLRGLLAAVEVAELPEPSGP